MRLRSRIFVILRFIVIRTTRRFHDISSIGTTFSYMISNVICVDIILMVCIFITDDDDNDVAAICEVYYYCETCSRSPSAADLGITSHSMVSRSRRTSRTRMHLMDKSLHHRPSIIRPSTNIYNTIYDIYIYISAVCA